MFSLHCSARAGQVNQCEITHCATVYDDRPEALEHEIPVTHVLVVSTVLLFDQRQHHSPARELLLIRITHKTCNGIMSQVTYFLRVGQRIFLNKFVYVSLHLSLVT